MVEEKVYEFKELDKFMMVTKAPGVEGRNSILRWSSYRGNPRISVFTGIATEKTNIHAAMNPETFLVFLNMLEAVVKDAKEDKYKLQCFTLPRNNDGSRGGEKIHNSDLWFGKDANGIVWISVVADGRPKIKFDFKISDFHKIFKSDGQPLSASEASCLQALSVIEALRAVMLTHMGDIKPPYEPKDGAKKFQGNGQSRPAAAAPKAEFDDISF